MEIDEPKKAEDFIRAFHNWEQIFSELDKESKENLLEFKELSEKFLKLEGKLSKNDNINDFIDHIRDLYAIVNKKIRDKEIK